MRSMLATSELFIAALLDETDLLRELLGHGANPNETDEMGFTPLHLAVRGGSVDGVRELLGAGADVDASTTPGGWTPLMEWVFYTNGQHEIPQMLCTAGAAVDRMNRHGRSALDLAREYQDYDLEWLLSGYTRGTSG
jgi:ankyrin repeat protein